MLPSGTRLGPYEIVAPIGAGGMGEVFRARDTRLDRSVAIKILSAEFANDAQLRLRLEREAKAISQLNHPNICTLYDVGENYLVMELLEGETLADRIFRGPMPLTDVLKYGVQIGEALEKAHRASIVHRDLKPGNVMLTKSGAKLLDFGLAKSSATQLNLDGATLQKPLTQEGTILGTFQYMSPEQLEGAEADARTDIFAFGTLLFEMATGKRAFEGKTRTSLIAAIVGSTPPPVSQIQTLTPRALDHVIAKCLEKDPDDRWQSAHDVAEELRWIGESRSETEAPRGTSRERIAWIVAAIAVIAASIAGFIAKRKTVSTIPYSFIMAPSSAEYQFAYGGIISPDGRMIAFSAQNRADGRRIVWVRPIDSLEARPLPSVESWSTFFWSADSRELYYSSDAVTAGATTLERVSVTGGPPQTVARFARVYGGDMNANGDVIVATFAGTGIHRIVGNEAKPITKLDAAHHEKGHTWPQFLPDGRHFLFLAYIADPTGSGADHRLYAGSLDGPSRYIGPIPSRVQFVDPGYLLFVHDGTLLAARFDPDKLELTGKPIPVLDDVFYLKTIGIADFRVSRTGTLIVKGPDQTWQVHKVSRDGQVGEVIGASGIFQSFSISPDGNTLALSMVDPKVGNSDLWLWGLDRATRRRLTFGSGTERMPVWSRDGTRIYYTDDSRSEGDIYVKAVDGSDEETIVLVAPATEFPRDVSPDSRYLLYQSRAAAQNVQGDLMILPLSAGAKPTPFLKTPFSEGGSARFSPDGRWVVYTSDETGRGQIYLKPFPGPGSARQVSTEEASGPRWSADGKRIYYAQKRTLNYVSFDASTSKVSNPSRIAELPFDIAAFEVANDGTFVVALASRPDGAAPNRVYTEWTRLLNTK